MKIGVLYMTNHYGLYFFSKLSEYATEYGISIFDFSYDRNDIRTIKTAVNGLAKSGLLITVLITNAHSLENHIISELIYHNRWQYPYYIGVDSWMNSQSINIGNYSFDGYIGSCPWHPTFAEQHLHEDANEDMNKFEEASNRFGNFSNLWTELYYDNESEVEFYDLNTDVPGLYSSYAYDLVYLVVHSLKYYMKIEGVDYNESYLGIDAKLFQDIMRNQVSFIGVTGEMSLDENGDRKNGVIGVCNVENNKSNAVKSVGYFNFHGHMHDGEMPFEMHLDEENISWPISFQVCNILICV